ncbi:MAG: FtsX-like permease family protein [Acidobacteria bacterium]|nr:FtsX-like permease family protein [Acidobacteriota bacterium]
MNLLSRFKARASRSESDPLRREIDEELRFHIEMRARANESAGMKPEAARQAAERSFGNAAAIARTGQDILRGAPPARDGASWFDTILQDLRYGWRMLKRHPLTTAAAILSLGLGIGANAANFSIVYGFLHRPLPVAEGHRLVFVDAWNPDRGDGDAGVTWADIDRMTGLSVFDAVGAYDERSFTVAGQEFPERVFGASVTPDLFDSFGIEPQLGRLFDGSQGAAYGFESTVIISDALWERMFARSGDVIGETILVNGREVAVVGVMPAGFRFPLTQDMWLPHTPTDPTDHQRRYVRAVARLAPGATLGAAQSQLRGIAADAAEVWPDTHTGWTLRGMDLRRGLLGETADRMLYTMFAAVGLVLLLACANVANIQLSRAPGRVQEFVLRAALGGSRVRLVRQLITESVVLGLAGGTLGLVVAWVWLASLGALIPVDMPYWVEIALDATTFGYTVLISMFTAVLFGVVPAFRIAGRQLGADLRASATRTVSASGGLLRNALVAGQLALAVILLVGATLTVRSFQNIRSADPGFDYEPLLSFRVGLSGDEYDDPSARNSFFDRLRKDLSDLPGVAAAAATSAIPADDGGSDVGIIPAGSEYTDDRPLYVTAVASTAGFFDTIDVDFLEGRDFSTDESAAGDRGVTIIGATLAARLWPGRAAVGEQIVIAGSGNTYDVIGVVPDMQYEEFGEDTAAARLQLHIPYTFGSSRSMALLVRGTVPPAQLLDPAREVMRSIDAGQAPYDIMTMTERRVVNSWGEGFMGISFGVFGGIALVLAIFGVYAVIAHMAAQRTREMGVRLALGARGIDVIREVLGSGLRMALVGVVLGGIGAWGVTRFLSGVLYGVSAREPVLLAGVMLLLGGAALIASLQPARRAASVDPTEALRSASVAGVTVAACLSRCCNAFTAAPNRARRIPPSRSLMLKAGCIVLSAWALLNLLPSAWIVFSILQGDLNAPGLYALLTPEEVAALAPDALAGANSIGVFANGLNVAYASLFLVAVWRGLARGVAWVFWALIGSAGLTLVAGIGADVVVGGQFLWMNVLSGLILAAGFACCAPSVLGGDTSHRA